MTAAAAPGRIGKLLLIEGLGPLADDGSDTLARWGKAYAERSRKRRPPKVFASIEEAVAARAACVPDIRVEHVAGPHHLHVRYPHEVAKQLLI